MCRFVTLCVINCISLIPSTLDRIIHEKDTKFYAFLAEDCSIPDAVGVKHRSKIWFLALKSLQPCVYSQFWIRLCVVILVNLYIENTSISLFLFFFHKLQRTGDVQCLLPNSNAFNQSLFQQIVSLEFICFLRTYSQFFPGVLNYHLRKRGGKNQPHFDYSY